MNITELKAKDAAELNTLLGETRKELADARRGLAAGELQNPQMIAQHRKTVARIMTVMSEKLNQEEEK